MIWYNYTQLRFVLLAHFSVVGYWLFYFRGRPIWQKYFYIPCRSICTLNLDTADHLSDFWHPLFCSALLSWMYFWCYQECFLHQEEVQMGYHLICAWLFASVIIDGSSKPPQCHPGCFSRRVRRNTCASEDWKTCENLQHPLSFPAGPTEGYYSWQMLSAWLYVRVFLMVLSFANAHAHKDKVTIQKSALLYNKNLSGCFTRCSTLLNWFEPRLDSLRLSHSNWLIKIREYALMWNWKRLSSFVFALFCLHRISSWVTGLFII